MRNLQINVTRKLKMKFAEFRVTQIVAGINCETFKLPLNKSVAVEVLYRVCLQISHHFGL